MGRFSGGTEYILEKKKKKNPNSKKLKSLLWEESLERGLW